MYSNADVIIMVTKKNIDTLKMMVPYVKHNISAGNIFVVASKSLKTEIEKIPHVIFQDEDHVVEGMSFSAVAALMQEISGVTNRTGWYFQQFLKLGWAYQCQNNYYIVIDADTFPLNKIDFTNQQGQYLFTQKAEYNKPYFDTLYNLFDGTLVKQGDFSFVAEHMAFDCLMTKEMLKEIVSRHPERGNTFYSVILHSINKEDLLKSGFSEFETYGTFVMTRYPQKAQLRRLRTLREAVYVLGDHPTEDQLSWAKNDYDIISIESSCYSTALTKLSQREWFRKIFRLRTIAQTRKKVRSIYRKMLGKPDFIFD